MKAQQLLQRFLVCSCLLLNFVSNGQINSKSLEVRSYQNATKDIMSWVTYEANQINWYEFTTALNQDGEIIRKSSFFDSLISGKFVPISLKKYVLKLYPVKDSISSDIISTVQNTGRELLTFSQKQGQSLSPFNFKDIDGNEITPSQLLGKVVVINCWFVRCTPCKAEMPDLNTLVKDYADNPKVAFISLCLDSESEIKRFLSTTEFQYQHIPDQGDFIKNRFGVSAFPSHVVVDKNLQVLKIMTGRKIESLRKFIETALGAK